MITHADRVSVIYVHTYRYLQKQFLTVKLDTALVALVTLG